MEILSSLTLFSIIFLKEFLLLFYFFLFSDGFYNYFLSLFENKIHPEEIKEEEIPLPVSGQIINLCAAHDLEEITVGGTGRFILMVHSLV